MGKARPPLGDLSSKGLLHHQRGQVTEYVS